MHLASVRGFAPPKQVQVDQARHPNKAGICLCLLCAWTPKSMSTFSDFQFFDKVFH